jgi:PAS domain S-box-containing protein
MDGDDVAEASIPHGVDSGVRTAAKHPPAVDVETALYALAARQAILAELGIMALGKKSLQAVLDDAVVCIRASLEVTTCSVLEILPGGKTLLVRAAAGWDEPIAGKLVVDAGYGSPAGYSLMSSEPVVAEDFSKETRFSLPPIFAAQQLRSGMSLIIHGRDRPFGVFSVQHRVPRKFTREEVDYFQAAANVLALAAERFQTEGELRRSEESFRSLIELAPDGVLISRGDALVYVNRALVEYLGYESAEDLLGRPALDAVHPDDRPAVESRAIHREGAARDAGSMAAPLELRLLRRDGATVLAEVASVPIVFKGQRSIAALIRDVTERKKMEARLQQNERLTSLGVLAAGVAHEINNPLMYVLGNLDFARRGLSDLLEEPAAPASPPGQCEASREERLRDLADMIDKARDGGERVRRIVADMKSFSRSGGDEDLALIDVRKVMASSINIARNEIRHRARLVVEEDDVPPVMAGDSRLGQVFLNLLLNAAHAIPEGNAPRNEITVRTRPDASGRVVVEVHDTGGGIPPSIQGKLFDPFFTTKPPGVGTGLGLAICHNIVTDLGGDITVESEVGRGTCFRVTLPAAGSVAPGPQKAPDVVPPPPLAPRAAPRGRVLIIDDEPFIAGLCRRALAPEHDAEVSTTARAALSRLESGHEFDVILCDLMMPDMSGMELFETIEQRFPAVAPRVVFLSGGAFTPAARSFRERVSNPFLDKPCAPGVLRDTVRQRVQMARSGRL